MSSLNIVSVILSWLLQCILLQQKYHNCFDCLNIFSGNFDLHVCDVHTADIQYDVWVSLLGAGGRHVHGILFNDLYPRLLRLQTIIHKGRYFRYCKFFCSVVESCLCAILDHALAVLISKWYSEALTHESKDKIQSLMISVWRQNCRFH